MKETILKLYYILKEFDSKKGNGYHYSFSFRNNSVVFTVLNPANQMKYSWSMGINELEKFQAIDQLQKYLEDITDELKKRSVEEENEYDPEKWGFVST